MPDSALESHPGELLGCGLSGCSEALLCLPKINPDGVLCTQVREETRWCVGWTWRHCGRLSHLQIPKRQVWSKERLPGCQDALLKSHHFTVTAPPSVWDPAVVWPPFLDPQVLCQASAQTKVSPQASPLSGPAGLCKVACLHLPPEPAPPTDGRADGGAGYGLGLVPTGQLRMVRSMCHRLPYQAVMSVPFTQVRASCLGLF